MSRYVKRRDGNEPAVIAALVAAGAAVQQLDGDGLPDLLVSYRSELMLLEVKLPLGPRGGLPERRDHEGGRGDLTRAQVKWWASWKGKPPVIVRTPEEAIAAIEGSKAA